MPNHRYFAERPLLTFILYVLQCLGRTQPHGSEEVPFCWDKRLWLKGHEHYENCDRERRPLIKTSWKKLQSLTAKIIKMAVDSLLPCFFVLHLELVGSTTFKDIQINFHLKLTQINIHVGKHIRYIDPMGLEWQDSGVKKWCSAWESFCAISLVFQNPQIPWVGVCTP